MVGPAGFETKTFTERRWHSTAELSAHWMRFCNCSKPHRSFRHPQLSPHGIIPGRQAFQISLREKFVLALAQAVKESRTCIVERPSRHAHIERDPCSASIRG